MAKLIPAGLKAGGIRSIRLADMKGAQLDPEHKTWLDVMIADAQAVISTQSIKDVSVLIIAFSSKSGSVEVNRAMSKNRAWAVHDYILLMSQWLATRITRWEYRGEEEAKEFGRNLATEGDDDWRWRAVEVHLVVQVRPVPPPSPPDPPLPSTYPGASLNWAVGCLGSWSMSIPGAPLTSVGVAVYVFQKLDQDKMFGIYFCAPVGCSIGLDQLIRWARALRDNGLTPSNRAQDPYSARLYEAFIKALLGGSIKTLLAMAKMSQVKVENAFRHKDVDGAGISLIDAGPIKTTNVSGKLPTFDRRGMVIRVSTKDFFTTTKIEMPQISPMLRGGGVEIDLTLAKFTGGGLLRLFDLQRG